MAMALEKQDLDMQSGSKPFLAIWMVAYNHEKFIEQAVESVLMQETDFDFKLFIGEDCSKDQTSEICKKLQQRYPDKIELFLNQKNLGPNKNALQIYDACFKSGAKYIAMLEGDDYWTDKSKLRKQVGFLESNPDFVLCFHKTGILKSDGEIIEDFLTKIPENYETIETLAQFGNYIHTPTVVYRNVLQTIPFEFEFSPIGDFFLYMMLAQHGKLKYLDENLSVYRYGVGMFSGKSELNLALSNLKLFSCLLPCIDDEIVKKIIFKRYAEAFSLLDIAIANQYKNHFVSDHIFFRSLKFFKGNADKPQRILKKVFAKIFKF
jgi:glycosyltransferase involved in cell wall biosynthesis